MVLENATVQSPQGLKVIAAGSRRLSPHWFSRRVHWLCSLMAWISWADVLHWYSGAITLPRELDLALVRAMNKPAIVEWTGSDIRVPEIEFEENPYYTAAFQNGYEYQSQESLARSRCTQKAFRDAGFGTAVSIGMRQYVQMDIARSLHIVPQRLVLADFQPVYPDPGVHVPVVVHSPTAPITKGTPAVMKAIDRLKTEYEFEFRLIQDMPRDEALRVMRAADIYLDQFVLGDYGMATLEAMALGKPVICYLKPSLVHDYPSDLPIVNASQDTLVEVLAGLIEDGNARSELGRLGRAYVEKYHDAVKVADHLASIYQALIDQHRRQ